LVGVAEMSAFDPNRLSKRMPTTHRLHSRSKTR
jgi:hypothetical protein